MNILKTKDKVLKLLKEHPHLRDDDNKLIANIWFGEIKGQNLTAQSFLEKFANGKLTNPESIRRMRQKLQEEFVNLRGNNWNERHKHQVKVKQQLFETPEILRGGTP